MCGKDWKNQLKDVGVLKMNLSEILLGSLKKQDCKTDRRKMI